MASDNSALKVAQTNSIARFCASAITWPVEKTKLNFQGGLTPLSAARAMASLSMKQHSFGMAASSLQRGGSAFLMFYTQSSVYKYTRGVSGRKFTDEALAGALSGAISAPFHTFWEIIKVKGVAPTLQSLKLSLFPMLLRHSVFDATFFAVYSLFEDYSSGIRFALAGASGSCTNLLFDLWKTRQMESAVKVPLFRVYKSLTIGSFALQYLVKGSELAINWFVVGCVKEYISTL